MRLKLDWPPALLSFMHELSSAPFGLCLACYVHPSHSGRPGPRPRPGHQQSRECRFLHILHINFILTYFAYFCIFFIMPMWSPKASWVSSPRRRFRHSLPVGLWPGPGRRQLWKLSSQNVLRFFCSLSAPVLSGPPAPLARTIEAMISHQSAARE